MMCRKSRLAMCGLKGQRIHRDVYLLMWIRWVWCGYGFGCGRQIDADAVDVDADAGCRVAKGAEGRAKAQGW